MFGWLKDPEDKQDLLFSYAPLQSAPTKLNLVEKFPLVYDQKQTNSCVAHAVSMAFMVQLLQQKEKFFSPSRLFVYYNARHLDNPNSIQDSGTYLRSGIKSVATYGACDESIWKFKEANVNIKPSKVGKFDPYISAEGKQVQRYERVPKSRDAIKRALLDGSAVVFGLYLCKNFQTQLVNNNFVFQKPDGPLISGHALIIVGWDDDKQCFNIRNSWSKNWGLNGHFWLPYEMMEDNNTDDLWKITFIEK